MIKSVILPILPSLGFTFSVASLWGFRWALREDVHRSDRIFRRIAGAATALTSALGFGLGLAILAVSLAGVIHFPGLN